MSPMMLLMVGALLICAFGGVAFAFADPASGKTKKRITAVAKVDPERSPRAAADNNQQRRRAMEATLRELDQQDGKQKLRPTLRRRIEQAGLSITPRTYWILASAAGVAGGLLSLWAVHSFYVAPLAGFACLMGMPRWALSFLRKRRENAFTREFAPAMDAIVRSIKTGLPVNEALKLVASENPEPVAGEFSLLNDSLRLGLTMDQGIKRMYQRMPTPEVNFFGIVMAIQSKGGGNLSEALANLANVLRDRKRLQHRIKAMSSEAKASAMIIGALPPTVAGLVYLTTPDYMRLLFTVELGNLMLIACGIWMTIGIFVMKKMIAIKY
jgi:tight adherence protein B